MTSSEMVKDTIKLLIAFTPISNIVSIIKYIDKHTIRVHGGFILSDDAYHSISNLISINVDEDIDSRIAREL